MKPVEQLRNDLRLRFPGLAAEIDAPADEQALWQLDVNPVGNAPWIVVEWKPNVGFGVSTPDGADYGMKPDEFYPDLQETFDRVVQLILSGETTSPGRSRSPVATRSS